MFRHYLIAIVLVALSYLPLGAGAQSGDDAKLRPPLDSKDATAKVIPIKVSASHVRRDGNTARRMAKYHWLDRAAQADPAIIEAICSHRSAAKLLCKHPRLKDIAEADHYLCRRLTKWKSVARMLASNPQADRVIFLDPEGIYYAIKRDRSIARRLAKNPMFEEMIADNPDLGKFIASYM